jgi:hypothetical protein
MQIIQPCCTKKALCRLRETTDKGGTRTFECYGDMSITELLPALMTRYAETEMIIAAPSIPDQAAEAIAFEMRRKWSRADGPGKMDEISHLTIITDVSRSPMLALWIKNGTYGDRLTVIDRRQEEDVILLPDLAILGFKNMRYSEHFIGTITGAPDRVAALWESVRGLDPGSANEREGSARDLSPDRLTTDEPANEKPAQAIRPKQAAKRKKHRRG